MNLFGSSLKLVFLADLTLSLPIKTGFGLLHYSNLLHNDS